MKISELIKRLTDEMAKFGDNEVKAVEVPPVPDGKRGWTLDLRY